MHPAEHRALRELHAAVRHLRDHWATLAARLRAGARPNAGTPEDGAAILTAGSEAAGRLLVALAPLTRGRGVPGRTAAQGVGSTLAQGRSLLADRTLEVNQALRLAALDVTHAVTLLGYLERLAAARGDGALATFHAGGRAALAPHEVAVRAAALAVGDRPDEAIAPADPSAAGRLGHRAAVAVGTLGEAVDRRLGR
jgi:hypothetical protein